MFSLEKKFKKIEKLKNLKKLKNWKKLEKKWKNEEKDVFIDVFQSYCAIFKTLFRIWTQQLDWIRTNTDPALNP